MYGLLLVAVVASATATAVPFKPASAAESLPLPAVGRWHDSQCSDGAETTCLLGDVDGAYGADVVQFTKSGPNRGRVLVSQSNGFNFSGGPKGTSRLQWHSHMCVDSETCMVADVNADGRADIVAFVKDTRPADAGDVWVALSTGSSFGPAERWYDKACVNPGEECYLADVDGQNGADIVEFVKSSQPEPRKGDVMVSKNVGSGAAKGWYDKQKYHDFFCVDSEICRVGDVTGDRHADLVAFVKSSRNWNPDRGDVWVAAYDPEKPVNTRPNGTFSGGQKWHDSFCLDDETCDVGDMDGDGRTDLVAFVKSSRPQHPDKGDMWVARSLSTYPAHLHAFSGATKWADYVCVDGEVCAVADVNNDKKADAIAFVGTDNPDMRGNVFVSASVLSPQPGPTAPSSPTPSPTSPPPSGVKTLSLYNCAWPDKRPVIVWAADLTAGTGWKQVSEHPPRPVAG